jgi:hypothetical protein
MEYLYLDEGGVLSVVKDREMTEEEQQNVCDGYLTIIRFNGRFEYAEPELLEADATKYEITWQPIK